MLTYYLKTKEIDVILVENKCGDESDFVVFERTDVIQNSNIIFCLNGIYF